MTRPSLTPQNSWNSAWSDAGPGTGPGTGPGGVVQHLGIDPDVHESEFRSSMHSPLAADFSKSYGSGYGHGDGDGDASDMMSPPPSRATTAAPTPAPAGTTSIGAAPYSAERQRSLQPFSTAPQMVPTSLDAATEATDAILSLGILGMDPDVHHSEFQASMHPDPTHYM
jgi:hypothetical protein